MNNKQIEKVKLNNSKRAAMKYVYFIIKQNKLVTNYDGLNHNELIRIVLDFLKISYDKSKGLKKELVRIYHSGECELIKKQQLGFYVSPEWVSLRKKVINKYGYTCMKCGFFDKSNHVDHIYPRSLYPEKELDFDNMQILCAICNTKKSNKDFTDYRKSLLL